MSAGKSISLTGADGGTTEVMLFEDIASIRTSSSLNGDETPNFGPMKESMKKSDQSPVPPLPGYSALSSGNGTLPMDNPTNMPHGAIDQQLCSRSDDFENPPNCALNGTLTPAMDSAVHAIIATAPFSTPLDELDGQGSSCHTAEGIGPEEVEKTASVHESRSSSRSSRSSVDRRDHDEEGVGEDHTPGTATAETSGSTERDDYASGFPPGHGTPELAVHLSNGPAGGVRNHETPSDTNYSPRSLTEEHPQAACVPHTALASLRAPSPVDRVAGSTQQISAAVSETRNSDVVGTNHGGISDAFEDIPTLEDIQRAAAQTKRHVFQHRWEQMLAVEQGDDGRISDHPQQGAQMAFAPALDASIGDESYTSSYSYEEFEEELEETDESEADDDEEAPHIDIIAEPSHVDISGDMTHSSSHQEETSSDSFVPLEDVFHEKQRPSPHAPIGGRSGSHTPSHITASVVATPSEAGRHANTSADGGRSLHSPPAGFRSALDVDNGDLSPEPLRSQNVSQTPSAHSQRSLERHSPFDKASTRAVSGPRPEPCTCMPLRMREIKEDFVHNSDEDSSEDCSMKSFHHHHGDAAALNQPTQSEEPQNVHEFHAPVSDNDERFNGSIHSPDATTSFSAASHLRESIVHEDASISEPKNAAAASSTPAHASEPIEYSKEPVPADSSPAAAPGEKESVALAASAPAAEKVPTTKTGGLCSGFFAKKDPAVKAVAKEQKKREKQEKAARKKEAKEAKKMKKKKAKEDKKARKSKRKGDTVEEKAPRSSEGAEKQPADEAENVAAGQANKAGDVPPPTGAAPEAELQPPTRAVEPAADAAKDGNASSNVGSKAEPEAEAEKGEEAAKAEAKQKKKKNAPRSFRNLFCRSKPQTKERKPAEAPENSGSTPLDAPVVMIPAQRDEPGVSEEVPPCDGAPDTRVASESKEGSARVSNGKEVAEPPAVKKAAEPKARDAGGSCRHSARNSNLLEKSPANRSEKHPIVSPTGTVTSEVAGDAGAGTSRPVPISKPASVRSEAKPDISPTNQSIPTPSSNRVAEHVSRTHSWSDAD